MAEKIRKTAAQKFKTKKVNKFTKIEYQDQEQQMNHAECTYPIYTDGHE